MLLNEMSFITPSWEVNMGGLIYLLMDFLEEWGGGILSVKFQIHLSIIRYC